LEIRHANLAELRFGLRRGNVRAMETFLISAGSAEGGDAGRRNGNDDAGAHCGSLLDGGEIPLASS